jgi:hypothetical protein
MSQYQGPAVNPSIAMQKPFQEHDLVALAFDLPEERLNRDAEGTIVHVYADGKAYEVEFASDGGPKVVTLKQDQLRAR